MRLHRLEVTAFGPFADTERLDFDVLNDAGLFLLTGHTGAGKTSILDAICFALFGAVPGARNGAKDLKSHHGPVDREPVVELEVTIRTRRLRIRRSPAWQKPSRRARTGYVDRAARATLEELVDAEWVTRSARLDEIAHLVESVLGMNRDQFCQVVMLPQGQFQTFLRAGAKERHDVLERLFRTGRFVQIERWLADHRRTLDAACVTSLASMAELAARAEEVSSAGSTREAMRSALPATEATLTDGSTPAEDAALEPESLVRRVTRWLHGARAGLAAITVSEATAASDAKVAQHALDEARETTDRRTRHRLARERLRELEATRAVVREREATIVRARAWSSLAPLLELLDDAARDARRDEARLAELRELCVDILDMSTAADALAHASRLRQSIGTMQRLADLEVQQVAERRERDEMVAELEHRRGHVGVLHVDEVALAAALTDAAEELRAGTEVAGRHTALQEQLASAASAVLAAGRAARLDEDVGRLRDRAAASREHYLDAQEAWLDVRRLRLDSMAAELAARLETEAECPVCGSIDHPRPAQPSHDHASAADEQSALAARNDAEQALAAAVKRLAEVQARHGVATAEAGGLDLVTAEVVEAELSEALIEAREALEEQVRLQQVSAELDTRLQELRGELVRADLEIETLTGRCAALEIKVTDTEATLSYELGADTVAAQELATLQEQVVVCEEAADALATWTGSQARLAELRGRVLAASAAHGFADLDDLRSAALSPAELANRESLNRVYAEDVAATARVVEDPVLVGASSIPAPDLEELQLVVACSVDFHVELRSAAGDLVRQVDRLEQLAEELEAAAAAWVPLRAAHDVALEVSSMCAGTSLDNRSRTKLSHYVLGARLQQVVDAANLRLTGISSGRYSLQHCMERGVGDARGGLGLLVLDTYTGQTRDPATLSGGETFYVSLSLALGLADLVHNEIGGAELSTLFVDEGFGSLDADTLDEVMDEIDALRSGGRSVGLVSHLAELRTRIPTQVQVVRGRSGSHIDPG